LQKLLRFEIFFWIWKLFFRKFFRRSDRECQITKIIFGLSLFGFLVTWIFHSLLKNIENQLSPRVKSTSYLISPQQNFITSTLSFAFSHQHFIHILSSTFCHLHFISAFFHPPSAISLQSSLQRPQNFSKKPLS